MTKLTLWLVEWFVDLRVKCMLLYILWRVWKSVRPRFPDLLSYFLPSNFWGGERKKLAKIRNKGSVVSVQIYFFGIRRNISETKRWNRESAGFCSAVIARPRNISLSRDIFPKKNQSLETDRAAIVFPNALIAWEYDSESQFLRSFIRIFDPVRFDRSW